MNPIHGGAVHDSPFGPEVGGAHSGELRAGVGDSVFGQNATAERRSQCSRLPDGRVIEAVDGASVRIPGTQDDVHDVALDSMALQLDEHFGSAGHRVENRRERRNALATDGAEPIQLPRRQLGDGLAGWSGSPRCAAQMRIVMNHHDTVSRGVHVELDPVGTQLQSPEKGQQTVLGSLSRGPAVRDQRGQVRGPRQLTCSFLERGTIQSLSLKISASTARSAAVGIIDSTYALYFSRSMGSPSTVNVFPL